MAVAASVDEDPTDDVTGVTGVCGRGLGVDRLGSLNDITNGVGVDVVNVLEGPDRPGVDDPRVVVGFNDDPSAVTTTEVVVVGLWLPSRLAFAATATVEPKVPRGIPGTPNVGNESFVALCTLLLWLLVRTNCSSSSSSNCSSSSDRAVFWLRLHCS